MTKLSIIVPCYNEEEAIPYFYEAMEKQELPSEIEKEYIFINDGSKDGTLEQLRKLKQVDTEHIHYISFSRNFGKEAGFYAGLEAATGDLVTVMDVDLQDPPELLPEMIRLIKEEDYDVVGTRRVSRDGEPKIRSFFARMFYKIINKISSTEMVDGARDFRLMTRQVVEAILDVKEYNRFSKGIFSWVGFKTTYLEYKNIEREHGTTSWNFWGLFKYSLEGIVNFSLTPLLVASFVGILFAFAAFVGIIIVIIRAIAFGDPTAGWPSMICIILFIGGIQMMFLGIIGYYIGKIFLETKKRPIYVVKEQA
jgi:glycosyltransferase involved in cell wall biosynthesis